MAARKGSVHDETIKAMTLAGKTAREIHEVTGLSIRQVGRRRRALGVSQPDPSAKLAPLEERLKQAAILFEDGPSVAEVSRTLHISRVVLVREFPDKVWTNEQSIAHSIVVRQGKRLLEGTTERLLPRRPGSRTDAA